ncbi:MAG: ROK family glucokinase [Lachnospiraceae bacterium]|nr:ROK family glucokinase [Lachnospiraceae bacterium]
MSYIFGVDVGGTTVKLGLFTDQGRLASKWEIPTRKEEAGKNILPDIGKSVMEKLSGEDISPEEVLGLGIGLPGPVDADGIIHRAVNLNWESDFSIPEALGEYLPFPIKAGNDANVAALGEMWKGGGQGFESIVLITLGTGIGGGVILKGKIWEGPSGSAGEIGHMHIEDEETLQCTCGNYGCLEQYASATGIVRLAERFLKEQPAAGEFKEAMEMEPLSAKLIFDLVRHKDPQAEEIATRFGRYLGKGLAAVACVVNPEVFVIGGGVSKAGELLFDYIRPWYQKYAFHACSHADFKLAKLGNDAGIYGSARLFL